MRETPAMTNQEWESRMNDLREVQLATQNQLMALAERHDRDVRELRDSQLVTQQLMETHERNAEKRFSRIEDGMSKMNSAAEKRFSRIEDGMLKMNSTMAEMGSSIVTMSSTLSAVGSAIVTITERFVRMEDNVALMSSAVATLADRIDRYIQGQGRDNEH
jgi:hypothetical protein